MGNYLCNKKQVMTRNEHCLMLPSQNKICEIGSLKYEWRHKARKNVTLRDSCGPKHTWISTADK